MKMKIGKIEEDISAPAITCSFVRVEIPQPPIVLEPAIKFTETVPMFSNTAIDEEFLNHPIHTTTGTSFTADYIFKKMNSDEHQFVDAWDVEMEPRVVLPEPLIVFEGLCVEVWEEVELNIESPGVGLAPDYQYDYVNIMLGKLLLGCFLGLLVCRAIALGLHRYNASKKSEEASAEEPENTHTGRSSSGLDTATEPQKGNKRKSKKKNGEQNNDGSKKVQEEMTEEQRQQQQEEKKERARLKRRQKNQKKRQQKRQEKQTHEQQQEQQKAQRQEQQQEEQREQQERAKMKRQLIRQRQEAAKVFAEAAAIARAKALERKRAKFARRDAARREAYEKNLAEAAQREKELLEAKARRERAKFEAAERAVARLKAELQERIAGAKKHYTTLGVERTANDQSIKKAYRKLSLLYHPDKNHAKEAKARFQEINSANQILSDPTKRAAYDAEYDQIVCRWTTIYENAKAQMHKDPWYN